MLQQKQCLSPFCFPLRSLGEFKEIIFASPVGREGEKGIMVNHSSPEKSKECEINQRLLSIEK